MVLQVIDFLQGKKFYIMVAIDALDQVGVYQGWWDEHRIREIVEGLFTAFALRAGVAKSSSVTVVK